ncbi:stress-response A/B barrel domain-containing protein UP3-like [Bidens hawaiensis]|uniref:stress-response A/B barrel domain-containing protein UP3-like n=1 Tax=Bidens hawaiensis TaxID=980011 RepID=UPI00404A441C
MSTHHQTVVLFNIKPDVDSTKVANMINEINVQQNLCRRITSLESTKPVIDVVDWISDGGSGSIMRGSVMRVALLKLKEAVGEAFSHEMTKGYSIAMIAVFDDVGAVDSDAELANLYESIGNDFVESEVFVDYVVPLS